MQGHLLPVLAGPPLRADDGVALLALVGGLVGAALVARRRVPGVPSRA